MMVLLTLLAALVPAGVVMWYFITKDRFPEPTHLLAKTFLWGVLITVPIILMELPLQFIVAVLPLDWLAPFLTAFLVAGFTEELFKLLILHCYCARKPDFDEPMDAVVYGVVVSLGFACLENVLYVTGGGMTVAAARAVTAIPAHASFGALMGYYYSLQHFGRAGRARFFSNVLWIPVFFHGLYDLVPMLLHSEVVAVEEQPLLASILLICFVVLMGWLFLGARRIVLELRAGQS